MQPKLQSLVPLASSIEEGAITQMDPRLQRIILMRRNGIRKRSTTSTAEDEVAVLAKVSDQKAWFGMTEVRAGVPIGPAEDGKSVIVTGRIPIKRIEFVRRLPFVHSLKAARRISKALAATITEMEAGPALPQTMRATGGKGAVVGIVDFGCDFVHKNFLTPVNKTRIKRLWNQMGQTGNTGVPYGALHTEADINTALQQPNPYQALGYRPGPSSHGTHVMDIAAGNGQGTQAPGLAPEADIIFVELASTDVPWDGPQAVGKNFGDSVQLLEAMKFIFDEAGNKPCVINASLGTNGGPHDGSTLVEQGIDSLVEQKPNRAVVLAASNSYADGIHAAGEVKGAESFDLPWIMPGSDITDNEMEIWYAGSGRLDVEIFDAVGTSFGSVPPGESGTVKDDNGDIVLFVANRLADPNNGDNMIGIYLNRKYTGRCVVRLKNTLPNAVAFHAWIERDDDGQSFFEEPHDNTHTLGSISCSKHTITVGSYDAHRPDVPLSYFSSSGPTRDGRQKPEVSAPGHDVWAAQSRSVVGVTSKSGTSMAAPAVSGAIVLMLAEAKKRNIKLSITQIRNAVLKAARKNPPTGTAWDPRYGFGRLSAKQLVAGLKGGSTNSAKKKQKKETPPAKKASAKKSASKAAS